MPWEAHARSQAPSEREAGLDGLSLSVSWETGWPSLWQRKPGHNLLWKFRLKAGEVIVNQMDRQGGRVPINHCKAKALNGNLDGSWPRWVDKTLPWWSEPLGQLESYRNFRNGTLFERKKTEMNLNCNLRKLRGPSSHGFQREVRFSQHMVGFERLLGGGKSQPIVFRRDRIWLRDIKCQFNFILQLGTHLSMASNCQASGSQNSPGQN